jgi:hypothetical protein
MSRVIVPDTTVIVRATQPAVDLEYIRRHVRALMHSDDVTLQTFLDAATTYFEEKTSTKVMYQTLETRFDACPASSGIIELPYAPLQDIVSVQYLDSGGDLQTLEDAGTSPATPLYGVWAPQGRTGEARVHRTAGGRQLASNGQPAQCRPGPVRRRLRRDNG